MGSIASWWASKVRQFRAHLRARVAPGERAALATWITPPQLALFDSMHVADRRHGLDVVASLRAERRDRAGCRCSPGCCTTPARATPASGRAWRRSLGEALRRVDLARRRACCPGFGAALERLRTHAETRPRLAAAAGCSPRTVELIRHQDAPRDPEFGELLRLADEAN